MPIHDWTKVNPGIFHDFHNAWITTLRSALNGGILPKGYYALGEQIAGDWVPDVLALRADSGNGHGGSPREESVATMAPPVVRIRAESRLSEIAPIELLKQRVIKVRHISDDRVVAMIEIVSWGNKSSEDAFRSLLAKLSEALSSRVQLLVIDLYPPTPRDPHGIHEAFWKAYDDEMAFKGSEHQPLTLAAYTAGHSYKAYVEPVAVGSQLPDMPLFFDESQYVYVPLEATYQAAFQGMPERWRNVLE